MRWRLAFLLALVLPDLPLAPFQGALGPSLLHPLGTDDLGRDGALRLLLAGARSLGSASACALLALALGGGLAWMGRPLRPALGALRSLPPLLLLLPLAAAGGLPGALQIPLLGLMLALHLEPALRVPLDTFRLGPAWAAERTLGAPWPSTLRRWAPWFGQQAAALFPSPWLGALWAESTLAALGLGPGPGRDSLGRLLGEELPRLSADPTPLGWAALALVLVLALSSVSTRPLRGHPR